MYCSFLALTTDKIGALANRRFHECHPCAFAPLRATQDLKLNRDWGLISSESWAS